MKRFVISGTINYKRVREFALFCEELKPNEAIEVLINSHGGEENCGRALAGMISTLRTEGRRVHTIGMGDIKSAAVLIFAAGEIRAMSRFAVVMVHESSYAGEGNSSYFKKTAKQMEADEQFWCNSLEMLTGTDSKTWMKLHEAETYLRPDDALKLNLATHII